MNGFWPTGIKRGIAVFFAAVLVLGGCSKEDEPPKGKNKVVVTIVKPAPEPAPVKAEPVEKAVPKEKVTPEEVASTGNQPVENATLKAEPPKESAPVAPSSVAVKDVTPSTAEEEASSPNKTAIAGSAGSGTSPAASKQKKRPEPEKGIARVREGESLSAFAARKDTCGDSLKWTRLYRLNPQRLAMLRTWKDITEKSLEPGLSLRYLSPADKEKLQSPFQAKPWVVTVRSWRSPGRLAAPAIKLIQRGFHVYITKAEVKGKQWLRLRVGFYLNKSEALAAKNKIREILGNDDSWIARAGKGELEEFGK
ncbi:MAG: SPOR domain-containing protein [Desulfatiglandaceae bacterium]